MNDQQWKYLFAPESVAVIGASNRPGSWGFGILQNLLKSSGRLVYPINPKAKDILGVKAYARVKDIPGPVDLAVIAVSASKVPDAFRDCAEKGVKTAVIVAGGFAETDGEGKQLEAELVDIAGRAGLRFVGPNTMGHADTTSQVNTLAWASDVPQGPVGLISQSGNFSTRIIETARGLGIGFSKVIVTGNESDLHLEDYLAFFAGDDKTEVIMAYIEGLRDGRRFFRLAKNITRHKPIVVIKSGGTDASAKAVMSHTGALAGSKAIYGAVFRQAGVIEVEDDEELCGVTLGLLRQPLPRGKKVGIMAIGGGMGVMTTEACERAGLEVPSIEAGTIEKLDEYLPPRWSRGNPVDMVGLSFAETPLIYSCLWTLMADAHVDAVLLLVPVPPPKKLLSRFFDAEEISAFKKTQERNLRNVGQRVNQTGKPVFFIKSALELAREQETIALLRRMDIPAYPSPRQAAKALKHMVWYRRYLDHNSL